MGNHNSPESLALAVNGYRFEALSEGSSAEELVLFLHGFPQFADAWSEIMTTIAAAGFRTVAVDQRGYSPGARPGRVEDYSVNELCSGPVLSESLPRSLGPPLGHPRKECLLCESVCWECFPECSPRKA